MPSGQLAKGNRFGNRNANAQKFRKRNVKNASRRALGNQPNNPSRGIGGFGVSHALDARSVVHVPGSRTCAPYLVIRDRLIIPVTSTASDKVFIFGEYMRSGAITPTLAISGSGTDVPGTTETQHQSPTFSGLASNSYELSLHALTVEIQCIGASGGLVPIGMVYACALPQSIYRWSFATWDNLASSVLNRRSMHRFTGYELLSKPAVVSTYPLDAIAHSTFTNSNGTGTTSDASTESLCPIVVIIDGVSGGTNTSYSMTVTAEWRARSSLDPILISMHKAHPATGESVWSKIMEGASSAGGFVHELSNASKGIGGVVSDIGATVNNYRTAAAGLRLLAA